MENFLICHDLVNFDSSFPVNLIRILNTNSTWIVYEFFFKRKNRFVAFGTKYFKDSNLVDLDTIRCFTIFKSVLLSDFFYTSNETKSKKTGNKLNVSRSHVNSREGRLKKRRFLQSFCTENVVLTRFEPSASPQENPETAPSQALKWKKKKTQIRSNETRNQSNLPPHIHIWYSTWRRTGDPSRRTRLSRARGAFCQIDILKI